MFVAGIIFRGGSWVRIPSPFELATERLQLRSPRAADAAELRQAITESHAELLPWMPWARRVPTAAEAVANCTLAESAFAAGTDYRLHLFLAGTDTLIGGSGMHNVDWTVPKVEIGYWVRTPCAGHGYVTEAVRAITAYALDVLGARRVEIRMSTRNERSRRIPERLGFVLEGVLRNDARHLDGSLRDTCVFALCRNADGRSQPGAVTVRGA